MSESTSDKHYESEFEFPLWKLIKQRAEEKDISYAAATKEVVPEYAKTIKYGDKAFEDAAIKKRSDEIKAVEEREQKRMQNLDKRSKK